MIDMIWKNRICLIGSNPSHLIKSNVLHGDVYRYCNGQKWCPEGNKTVLCPLFAAVCERTKSDLCPSGRLTTDIRVEQGVPGLKHWQLSGASKSFFCDRENEWSVCVCVCFRKSFFTLSSRR